MTRKQAINIALSVVPEQISVPVFALGRDVTSSIVNVKIMDSPRTGAPDFAVVIMYCGARHAIVSIDTEGKATIEKAPEGLEMLEFVAMAEQEAL